LSYTNFIKNINNSLSFKFKQGSTYFLFNKFKKYTKFNRLELYNLKLPENTVLANNSEMSELFANINKDFVKSTRKKFKF
jgi:hypothetical protein